MAVQRASVESGAASEPQQGIPLPERLHALIAGNQAGGGLRIKISALAERLGVSEALVRRAVKALVEAGRIRVLSAGREGTRLILESPPPGGARRGRKPAVPPATYCPWCGETVADAWRFCMGCGEALPARG